MLLMAKLSVKKLKIENRYQIGHFRYINAVEPHSCDHLSSATSFPKYQKSPSQIAIVGASCKRPHLVRDCNHF